ncbi:hypothetical protein [Culicoidibacter larvae]|uniref:Uncharacterized protein n=1 Tax=Culicoidibacter larvae TaxID=2579976 RepID=A0A5R8QHG4_9FIRM|nr:hypothetical protein [Culicoidibacter larvae]TLG77485.1 hypothetical protein FEZ08_02360 [Culicoidibacter larvae]
MKNNTKANLMILTGILALASTLILLPYATEGQNLLWFLMSAIILLIAIFALVLLHRQAKTQVTACDTEVVATVKWWETGSGNEGNGVTLMMVLDVPVHGQLVEKGYIQRGGIGIAELTQFLDRYPFGAALPVKINPDNLATIILAENDLVLSDQGEALIKKRMNK